MPDSLNVLFLCTGNSCRSQIAEGWARHIGGDSVVVQSAGIEAHGKNPRAIQVMREIGIDISGQESIMVNDDMLKDADVVVTVCGHADEQCPALPRSIAKLHWSLTDPAKAVGTEEQIMTEFRATRAEIKGRVSELLESIEVGELR